MTTSDQMPAAAALGGIDIDTPRPAPRLKRLAPELRSEAVLSAIVGSLDEAVWSTSPDGERVYIIAGGVERTLGVAAAEFLETPGLWFGIAAAGDRDALRAAFRQLSIAGRFHVEYSIQTPAGSIRRVSSQGKLIRSPDGQPLRVDGITADISRRSRSERSTAERIRELESRLAAAEAHTQETARLEAVGRLLAGAAHDLNNFLTVVTGHAELLRENLMANDPLRESVDSIAAGGRAAARVARQLVAYAKPAAAEPAAIDPNAAMRDAEPVLRRFTGDQIELDLLLSPGVAPIRVDRGEFDRVVLNLVVNARDAIEESGTIAVRTAMAAVAAGCRGWPAECPPGDYVALTVADTGCGMTADVQARAFTRFFTTKGSKGSGLGLAAVRDIATAAGGHVELESSPEWGTSVRVFWPALADDEPIRIDEN